MVQPIGTITLPVSMGAGLYTVATMANFLVFKAHSSYNEIIERPTLNNLKVVKVHGKQVLARESTYKNLGTEEGMCV